MIEVFKTDVHCPDQARRLVDEIQNTFEGYVVNFDLENCDRILRVKAPGRNIETVSLIAFLLATGCCAEVLQDE